MNGKKSLKPTHFQDFGLLTSNRKTLLTFIFHIGKIMLTAENCG